MPRGGARPGAGRPKGVKDGESKSARDRAEREARKAERAAKSIAAIKVGDDSNSIIDRDEKEPELIDSETGQPVTTDRIIKLSNLRHIRIEMAHVYRAVDAGLIQSQDGSRRAYILKTIAEVIAQAEFEKRLEQIEQAQRRLQDERNRPALPSYVEPAESDGAAHTVQ